ncbi:hypothetical protein [Lacinutrix sp. MEBiC02595]
MKNNYHIIIWIFLLTTTISCSKSEENNIEKWDDNIGLSQKNVEFTSDNNNVTITTEYGWCLAGISLNGNYITPTIGIDINPCSNTFIIGNDEFSIQRNSKTEILIEMNENQTNSERVLRVDFSAGNYFDRVIITQSAE